jgi:hypothetical protein
MAGSSATGQDERGGHGRWIPPVTVVALLAVIVAACGGGGLPPASGATTNGTSAVTASPAVVATPSPSPTAQPTLEPATPVPTLVPTPAPTPSGSGSADGGGVDAAALAAAAERLTGLASYRFTVVIRQTNVAVFGGGDVDMTVDATIIRSPVPASHILMVGKLEPMKGTVEAITIGDNGWARMGGAGNEWKAAPPGGAADLMKSMEVFEPGTLYKELGSEIIGKLVRLGIEEHNGIQASHYAVDAAALPELSTKLKLKGEATLGLWVAEQQGYLVALTVHGKGVTDTGQEGEVFLSVEVSHLDDPANVVEPPIK